MEEFKEKLIKLYVDFIYEGQELVNFYNNIYYDRNINLNEKYKLLISHCLEHNVIDFIKTSSAISNMVMENLNSIKLQKLKNNNDCFHFRKFFDDKKKDIDNFIHLPNNELNDFVGFTHINKFDRNEYLKNRFLYYYGISAKHEEANIDNIINDCSSYNRNIDIFRNLLFLYNIDFKNILV